MAAYDEQLMSLLTDMEPLKTDIDNKEGEIDQAKTDLAAAPVSYTHLDVYKETGLSP